MSKCYTIQTEEEPVKYLNFNGHLTEDISEALQCAAPESAEVFKTKYEEENPDGKISLIVKEVESTHEL